MRALVVLRWRNEVWIHLDYRGTVRTNKDVKGRTETKTLRNRFQLDLLALTGWCTRCWEQVYKKLLAYITLYRPLEWRSTTCNRYFNISSLPVPSSIIYRFRVHCGCGVQIGCVSYRLIKTTCRQRCADCIMSRSAAEKSLTNLLMNCQIHSSLEVVPNVLDDGYRTGAQRGGGLWKIVWRCTSSVTNFPAERCSDRLLGVPMKSVR